MMVHDVTGDGTGTGCGKRRGVGRVVSTIFKVQVVDMCVRFSVIVSGRYDAR